MFLFMPPENIREPEVFWCFQGYREIVLARIELKKIWFKFSGKIFIFESEDKLINL